MRPRDAAAAAKDAEKRKAQRDAPKPSKRGGKRPSPPSAIVLQPLSDHVLDVLFRQAIIGMQRGDPYLDGVRRLARLIEAELQGQVLAAAHRRR